LGQQQSCISDEADACDDGDHKHFESLTADGDVHALRVQVPEHCESEGGDTKRQHKGE